MNTSISKNNDQTPLGGGIKTLFLDRDGVININHGYVYRQQDCEFVKGIFPFCKQAQEKGYQIIIVTNQSGIARKYYSQEQFKVFSRWIKKQFWQQGIKIKQTLYCPHHPKFKQFCTCRKPKIGMIIKAQRLFKADLSQSILVGDSLSDMHCAHAANIKKSVLLNINSLHCRSKLNNRSKLNSYKLNSPKLKKPNFKLYYQAKTLNAIRPLL